MCSYTVFISNELLKGECEKIDNKMRIKTCKDNSK